MKYVPFGSTGVSVSRLCLGGMMFSRKIDPDGTRRVFDEALDAGINFIDTAESYTDSEEYIGRAGRPARSRLSGDEGLHQRAGEHAGRNSPANIETSLDHSLQQLRTDRIDLYQLHHPDADTPLDETVALNRAIKGARSATLA